MVNSLYIYIRAQLPLNGTQCSGNAKMYSGKVVMHYGAIVYSLLRKDLWCFYDMGVIVLCPFLHGGCFGVE